MCPHCMVGLVAAGPGLIHLRTAASMLPLQPGLDLRLPSSEDCKALGRTDCLPPLLHAQTPDTRRGETRSFRHYALRQDSPPLSLTDQEASGGFGCLVLLSDKNQRVLRDQILE